MQSQTQFEVVLVHAEGEIGRVVTAGVPPIPGATMLAKLNHLNAIDDSLRRKLVNEPRGSFNMSTNLLLEPTDPSATAAYLILQPDKAHAMSGSNSICVVTALLETGRVAMTEPKTCLTLETPAGLVQAEAKCSNGKCEQVTVRMPPAYVHELDVAINVAGIGNINLDIAFGGCFYGLIDPSQVDLEIEPANAAKLIELGMRILQATNDSMTIKHPELEGIEGLSYVMFAGKTAAGDLKHATIIHPGRIDRSPCGTGSAARLAVMHARGEVNLSERLSAYSIIDSRFDLRLQETVTVAGADAVITEVTGRGWIYGTSTLGFVASDPWPHGYEVGG